MKRVLRALFFILLAACVLVVSFYAEKTDLWQQDVVVENSRNWKLLKTGWSVRDKENFDQSSSICISKVFHVNEVKEMLGGKDMTKKTFMPKNGALSVDWPVLFFITHNQNVLIYGNSGSGDLLIYSFGNNGTQYVGSESGNALHCVTLPEIRQKDVTITIKLFPSYDTPNLRFERFLYGNSTTAVPKLYFGWRTMCFMSFFKSTLFQSILIILIYALGLFAVCAFLATLIMRKVRVKQYLYWGLFALVCATGFLMESKMGLLLFDNSYLIYFLSTVIISLYPRMFLIYMQERMILEYNETIARIFRVLTPINVLIVCAASFFTVVPFIFVRYYVCIVLMLFILFMVISVLRNIFAMGGRNSLFDIAIIVASVCIFIDMVLINFRRQTTDLFFFSRLGMLFFFIVCTVLVANEFYEGEILKARSSALEKMAFTDVVTGCKNTAALWHDNKRLQLEQKGFVMALVFIRNISAINKAESYESGDNAVSTVAQFLREKFSKDSVYRLNGTKLCILLQNKEIKELKENIDSVKQSIEAYNQNSDSMAIELAGTAGIYNEAEDHDFDGIYIRLLNELREQQYS